MAMLDPGKVISNLTVISVGAGAASDLYSGIPRPAKVHITNLGPQPIYLGGPSVTAVTGIRLLNGGDWEDEASASEELYAITAAATADVRIMIDLGTPEAD